MYFLLFQNIWDFWSLYNLYEWAHTPWEWHADLFKHANKLRVLL